MSIDRLHDLARRWGVQTGYWDVSGTWRDTSADALVAVLASLGAAVSSPEDAGDAVAAHERALATVPLEPVLVAPGEGTLGFELRLPAGATGSVKVVVVTEGDDEFHAEVPLDGVAPHGGGTADGRAWELRWIDTGLVLPVGYHHAVVEAGETRSTAAVLAPPARLRSFDRSHSWGVFAPTYGFVPTGRAGHDHLGVGHVGHLADLGARIAPLGGRVVSTLPLLATFLDEPFEPSPYSPVSRRWWSELHLDPARLPGLDESPTALEIMGSSRVSEAAERLASEPLLDHREAASLVRSVLDAVTADVMHAEGSTAAKVAGFAEARPELEQYARFRALVERFGPDWGRVRPDWLGRSIERGDVDPAAVARHRYTQYAAERQMADLAAEYRSRDQLLALDLPLGANPDGFDVWANPGDFATGMATGAPPDEFFGGGQNWGFPPMHPITSRARGHEELKLAVRHHVRHSGLLRVDHLMSLERLWWIPSGHGATDGAYVRYPTHELMAVIAIEAERADAVVMGENLGTVTDEINDVMDRWQMLGMYELQFETWRATREGRLEPPSRLTVAGLNTHDMPPFGGWWVGADIDDALDLGLIGESGAVERHADRRAQIEALADVLGRELDTEVAVDPAAVLQAALAWLGRAPAQVILATLEDLWLEQRPQNVPGTHRERPNWRRRLTRTLDDAFADPTALAILTGLSRARADVPSEETS
ncbi:MAG: 4-alpha-glucanotransferase [Acidimicrobiales bacterium]